MYVSCLNKYPHKFSFIPSSWFIYIFISRGKNNHFRIHRKIKDSWLKKSKKKLTFKISVIFLEVLYPSHP